MTRSPTPLSALIDQGRGVVPADVVLKGARVAIRIYVKSATQTMSGRSGIMLR